MRDFFKIFGPVAILIVVLWFGWWGIANQVSKDMASRGQLGDLFGGINALFSGLALAGVVTAVVLQSHELRLQRDSMNKQCEELELTRNEIKLQREQLELQREELKLSREEFERMACANEEAAKVLSNQLRQQVQAAKINGVSSLLGAAGSLAIAQGTATGKVPRLVIEVMDVYTKKLNDLMEGVELDLSKPENDV
jgi:hypothetical protein